MNSSPKLNIVVVGAGAVGALTARNLSAKLDSSKYNLILLDSRPYRILLPATIRMLVSDVDHLEDTALVPIDERLFFNGNGKFIVDTVQTIEKQGKSGGQLLLGSGQRLPYHALVLTPGSIWEGILNFPDDPEQFKTHLRSTRAKFEKAQKIVIAGGGAVGIEFSGEIKDIWPHKEVTIVQGDGQVLNKSYPDKYRKTMERSITSRGVKVVYNDYIDTFPEPGSNVVTRKGKLIEADLVIQARGGRPNTAFVQSLGDVLTERGLVKIRPTFQLRDHADIFAGGDVIDWQEQKQAAKALKHSGLLADNVLAFLSDTPLKDYKGSMEMIIVINGKNKGAAYFDILWGITLGPWFAKMIKAKNLMIPMMRKAMGN